MKRKTQTDLRSLLYLTLAAFALTPAAYGDDEKDEVDVPADAEEPVPVLARTPALTQFPDYPPRARLQRIEGEATVCFKVAPNGRVLDPAIESSTHKIFEKPALAAIRASTFEPLGPGETVSAERMCRTFRFRLEPVATADSV
jgi:TonB family protein